LSSPAVGRGAVYLYLHFLSSIVSGYIFWILITKFATTETIGNFALIISLAEIFANIAILGIPDGVQRFLAKSFSEKRLGDARAIVRISLILLFVGIIISSGVTLIFNGWFQKVFGIHFNLIVIINLILASNAVYLLLYSVVIASLRTQVLPIIIVISSASKIIVGIIAVSMDTGVWGLALGYTFLGQSLSSLLLGIVIKKILNVPDRDKIPNINIRNTSTNLMTASLVAWVPNLISIIGLQLGTLVVFGMQGPDQSGVYFIVIMLFSGINSILIALYTIALPVLSSMEDGRKRFAWQTIRLSSIVTLPLSSSLLFYAKDIMQFLGPNYTEGSTSFQILLLSVFPNAVAAGVDTLVYSYGHYRSSLAITIAISIPRTVLYFLLVPHYGATGAAISYTIGSLIGFVLSIVVSRRVPMKLTWNNLLSILAIPMAVNFILAALHITYIIGIPISVVVSYMILISLNIVSRSDLAYIVQLLPYRVSQFLIKSFKKVEDTLSKFHE
jgi:O-antigen/teichoic acid export membrane protein